MGDGEFNLIERSWLPVRRRSGGRAWIRPAGITEAIEDDPVVAFDWGRPDFDAAAHEFLIGLLATTLAPADEDAWYALWATPPTPDRLDAAFAPWAQCFSLDGPGPRFMQDLDELAEADEKEISGLLIDAPGDNALRNNTDFFIKRGRVPVLGRAAAAMALFTLQTYAPSGGVGHRTSLRGGGPLTTLVDCIDGDRQTLWHRLWLAVEDRAAIANRNSAGRRPAEPQEIFPWTTATRSSNTKAQGRDITQADVHALQVYWGMPRRVRLVFEPAAGRSCALTGCSDAYVATSYRTLNYGNNYTEGFLHPLTPYYRSKAKDPWLPVHGQPVSLGYRHWLGLLVNDEDATRRPAEAVTTALRRLDHEPHRLRLLVYGYDMDNMKPRGFVSGHLPIIAIDRPETRERAMRLAEKLIKATQEVAGALEGAVKAALFEDPAEARGDLSFVRDRLWRETETAFYDAMRAGTDDIPERWRGILAETTLSLFDEAAGVDAIDIRATARIARARRNLGAALRGYGARGKKLFGALGLPLPADKARRARAKTTSMEEPA